MWALSNLKPKSINYQEKENSIFTIRTREITEIESTNSDLNENNQVDRKNKIINALRLEHLNKEEKYLY